MENSKVLIVLLVILIGGCSIFTQPEDGWEYIYLNDPVSALTEFSSAYGEDPSDAKTAAGLSYAYLLLDENESSGVYASIAAEADSSSKYTVFSLIAYTRFNSCTEIDPWFKKFIADAGYTALGFYLDTIISNGSVYKLGLTGEFINEEYEYSYGIMKKISSIPDTLDMGTEDGRKILWDYISRISE